MQVSWGEVSVNQVEISVRCLLCCSPGQVIPGIALTFSCVSIVSLSYVSPLSLPPSSFFVFSSVFGRDACCRTVSYSWLFSGSLLVRPNYMITVLFWHYIYCLSSAVVRLLQALHLPLRQALLRPCYWASLGMVNGRSSPLCLFYQYIPFICCGGPFVSLVVVLQPGEECVPSNWLRRR